MTVKTDAMEVLERPNIDAVAIVTPISHHFPLAKIALENGQHVFVEKPFTRTSDEGKQLIELADRKKRMIMVDHTFLFCRAVSKIRALMDHDVLGTISY